MLIAAVALVLLGALWGVGGPRKAGAALARDARRAAPGAWRPGAGGLALLALVAALVLAVRGDWLFALIALALAAGLSAGARRRGRPRARPQAPPAPVVGMSRRDAAALLGVAETAPSAEVQSAYARLMRRAHPDVGGTVGLAAQLNLARDTLLAPR